MIRRLPRRTIRLRLTLIYGGLFVLSGIALLTLTYFLLIDQRLIDVSVASHPPAGVPGDPGTYTEPPPTFGKVGPSPQILWMVALVLAVMAAISLGLGWLMAGRVLRPLRTITAATRASSASTLHRRLAMTGPDDEIKELGDTIDGLLDRLDAAFRAQRQFVANASHELRTPLARARTMLEVKLRDPATDLASLRETCARVIVAGEQQERLIEALLTLARSERGLGHRLPVNLGALAREVLPARTATGHDLHVDARLAPAPTTGDSRLLERMVANLFDNALRHNVPGGSVWISTGIEAGHPALRVANTGPVIPAHDLDRLWQPFQQLGSDRTSKGPGIGLGLSIVMAIATAHDAVITKSARPGGGLDVEVRFPKGAAQGP